MAWPWSMTTTWSARPSASSSRWVHIADGLAALGHLVDETEHGARQLGVEARGGLVEEQEVGFVEDGPGQHEAGPHPGRVAADLEVQRLRDPEPVRGLGDAPFDQAGVDLEQRRRVLQVVGAREAVVQRGRRTRRSGGGYRCPPSST